MKIDDVRDGLSINAASSKSAESKEAEVEETDAEGSEPSTDKKEGKDDKEEASKASDADEKLPWHEDKRFKKDLALLKTAKKLIEANGLESIDELVEYVEKGKKVRGKNVDLDKLDEIAAKAAKLEQYETYWKQQEESKLRDEDPDNYTKQLEKKLQEIQSRDKAKYDSEMASRNAKQAVDFYDRTVQEMVDDNEDLPIPSKQLISLVMGVKNPTNDIDITDRRQIKKTYTEIMKTVQEFGESMKKLGAEEYRKGKIAIPKVTTTAPATTSTEKKVYLKDARLALIEKFKQGLGG